jgi:4-amino-4-deoxy-L-arabinose transferase-like glycosyltransferase
MISLNMTLGLHAAFSAGLLASFSPLIIQAAHYFKEDTFLLFGVTAIILSVSLYEKFRNIHTVIFAGIAAAFAASSKYAGLIFLPVVLFFLLRGRSHSIGLTRKRRAMVFLSAFILAGSLLNYQAFYYTDYISEKLRLKFSKTFNRSHTQKTIKSVKLIEESTDISIANARAINKTPGTEKSRPVKITGKNHDRGGLALFTGHGGVVSRNPAVTYIRVFFTHTFPAIPLLAIIFLMITFITKNKISVQLTLLITLFFTYFFAISLGKSTGSRYFIPISLITHIFAALGIFKIAELAGEGFHKRLVSTASLFFVFILVIPAYSEAAKIHSMFDTSPDNRREMIEWLDSNIHQRAVIAADSYTRLTLMINNISPGVRKLITVKEMTYTGDLGSIKNARKLGITHVIACSRTYKRFFNTHLTSSDNSAGVVDTRRRFYSELFRNGRPVWESRHPDRGSLNPIIKIYHLDNEKCKKSQ